MRERPTTVVNITAYETADVSEQRSSILKWQYTTQELLINAYGEKHRHVISFAKTITDKDIGFYNKEVFRDEVSGGLSVFRGIVDSRTLVAETKLSIDRSNSIHSRRIFIVHGHDKNV